MVTLALVAGKCFWFFYAIGIRHQIDHHALGTKETTKKSISLGTKETTKELVYCLRKVAWP